MNLSQLVVLAFAVSVAFISIWAVVSVIRSPTLRFKPLWIVGSLFGFIGLGINWTTPDDVILLFGVSIPVVMVFTVLATGQTIVKTGFPIIALAALIKVRFARANQASRFGDTIPD